MDSIDKITNRWLDEQDAFERRCEAYRRDEARYAEDFALFSEQWACERPEDGVPSLNDFESFIEEYVERWESEQLL